MSLKPTEGISRAKETVRRKLRSKIARKREPGAAPMSVKDA